MPIETVPGAKTRAHSEYVQRIDRVIDHLRRNLDRPVKLGELAGVACFSEFHFHRIFTAVSGDLHKVATAWDYLYRDWLINSAFEPEHAPALEIFLDKESATDWSHFELDLCLPVQKPAEMKSSNSGSRMPLMVETKGNKRVTTSRRNL